MRVLSLTALSAIIFFPSILTSSHLESLEVATRIETPAAEVAVDRPVTNSMAEQDLRCLALNIYHEARSESEAGQVAVARVTMNRVASKSFPGSVCAVVKQGGIERNRCQFSWWCDGRSDRPTNQKAWRKAMEIARRVMDDVVSDPTHGALYYHASYCKPSWSSAYKRTTRIGQHLFYRPVKI
ncbi:cell wall hydrolase [Imhoffiella purpurea]|uniref:Cell wall hydrolase SleB domain-containing protein n=1 Tax=Imhoffiella purpurea TaxID=1249627 RepID=W9VJ18_9GAMM|nr:cell wall hydrolase [Imhoffiella purpurea]EXJ16991.1 hypothetical protein D779_1814 [Imhoffiella purpurea]